MRSRSLAGRLPFANLQRPWLLPAALHLIVWFAVLAVGCNKTSAEGTAAGDAVAEDAVAEDTEAADAVTEDSAAAESDGEGAQAAAEEDAE